MKTILIVDDEMLIRWSIREALKDRYRVLTAASVDEAVRILETETAAVLLTDLKMPGKDGVELVAHARRRAPDMKIFVITAFGSKDSMDRCYTLEIDGYIRKPFDLRLIRQMVDLHAAPMAS